MIPESLPARAARDVLEILLEDRDDEEILRLGCVNGIGSR